MGFYELQEFDVNRDEPNIRTVDLRFNKAIFEREDPYGFWKCHLEKGALPDHLTGVYTSYDDAYQAVIKYMTEKKRTMEFKVKPKTKDK